CWGWRCWVLSASCPRSRSTSALPVCVSRASRSWAESGPKRKWVVVEPPDRVSGRAVASPGESWSLECDQPSAEISRVDRLRGMRPRGGAGRATRGDPGLDLGPPPPGGPADLYRGRDPPGLDVAEQRGLAPGEQSRQLPQVHEQRQPGGGSE